MGTKNNPGAYDCYADADPDEPLFVLRAKDRDAPDLVRVWANERMRQIVDGRKPESDLAKVREAMKCAVDMEEWRFKNVKR